MILKFGTKFDSDELYCVTKKQSCLPVPYLFIFLGAIVFKFCRKLDSDELYCVSKNSHILLISLFICSFFFLSNENFCRRFLSSY